MVLKKLTASYRSKGVAMFEVLVQVEWPQGDARWVYDDPSGVAEPAPVR